MVCSIIFYRFVFSTFLYSYVGITNYKFGMKNVGIQDTEKCIYDTEKDNQEKEKYIYDTEKDIQDKEKYIQDKE